MRFLEDDLSVGFGGIVDALHQLGGDDSGIDVGSQLLAGADAAEEGIDLVLEVVAGLILGGGGDQSAALATSRQAITSRRRIPLIPVRTTL